MTIVIYLSQFLELKDHLMHHFIPSRQLSYYYFFLFWNGINNDDDDDDDYA